MSLISRYLLTQFLQASALFFFGLVVTWVAADSVLHLDDFSKDSTGGLEAVLRALDVVPLGLPVSCLVGAVWSLSRAVHFREITAIRCGGVALRRALLPVLVASLALGGLLLLFEDRVIVPIRRAALERSETQMASSIGTLERFQDRFWYSDGSSIFIASGYSGKRGSLEQVTVFEFDDKRRIHRRIDAREARLVEETLWAFDDAVVREFKPGDRLERETAQSLTLDLGVTSGSLWRNLPSAETTTLHRLVRELRQHPGDPASVAPAEAALHGRIAQPLSILILVLFAIPFSIPDAERGDSLPRALLASLSLGGLFLACFTGALLIARTGLLPPAFPIWGTVLAALGIGVWRFRALSE
ncbi:MAG: YjgP/YjgQ family permease [Myxococcales bacterium]|nr:YjgP/YjgQ family permease [Myxococcales bacterium]